MLDLQVQSPVPSAPSAPASPAAPGPGAVGAAAEREVPTQATHPDENIAERLFHESCLWIANGGEPIERVTDSVWAWDARFDLEGTRQEGPMRLWLQLPDLYRQEMELPNSSTPAISATTKVMNRSDLYVKHGAGQFRHMNRTPDGAMSVKLVQHDMQRLSDMTTFLTLEGLKGPGVKFEYLGEKTPSGAFARPDGRTWAKIVRKAAGRPDIYFWLAHTRDPQGVMHATYPGVVRVDGDPLHDIPTEDFLFQDWREPPAGAAHRYRTPRKILAYQIRPGQPSLNFLTAFVTGLEINNGIDPSRFEPK